MIPISLGVLDIVKAGAQRLLLVRYTRGLYDPGPGTGSEIFKINISQSVNQKVIN